MTRLVAALRWSVGAAADSAKEVESKSDATESEPKSDATESESERETPESVPESEPEASTSAAPTTEDRSTAGRSVVRTTDRWRGIVAVVLIAAAVGILAKRPSLLLVAAVGVVFATYPLVTTAPDPTLSVRHRIDPESPEDGTVVTVRTTVCNEGDSTLFDLRVVDGTPPMLSVVGGSPRCATALAPGDEVTLRYELLAKPGRHRFQPATLLCRDASGSTEVETTVTTDTEIECAARVPTVPLRTRSHHRTGPLVTDEGGNGLEFHAIDEYERGDPASRIDWRRFARTGELTSVTFRTERLVDAVVCIDARLDAYRASADSEPHAVAHAVDAAGRIGDALFAENHRVGLAAFGRDSCLLLPGSGRDHADRFHRRLATDPALTLVPPEPVRTTQSLPSTGVTAPTGPDRADSIDEQISAIRERIGSNCQVLLLTPLCDDESIRIAQRFEGSGPSVIVVSPDVTTDRTAGGRLARLERDHRLTALRNAGVPAIDWDPGGPLGAALAGVERGNR